MPWTFVVQLSEAVGMLPQVADDSGAYTSDPAAAVVTFARQDVQVTLTLHHRSLQVCDKTPKSTSHRNTI